MRLSIFTKLFLVYTILTIVPLIVSASLMIFSYEKTIENFFIEEKLESFPTINQGLFPVLIELKMKIVFVMAFIVFLSLLSSFLIAQGLIRPLRKIVTGIKEVSSGNLDFKIAMDSKDELGESVRYFNEMTDQLKKAKLVMEEEWIP